MLSGGHRVTSMRRRGPGETTMCPACWGGSRRSWEQPGWSCFPRPTCGIHAVWGLNSMVPGQWPCLPHHGVAGAIEVLSQLCVTLETLREVPRFLGGLPGGGGASLGRPCPWKSLGCGGNRIHHPHPSPWGPTSPISTRAWGFVRPHPGHSGLEAGGPRVCDTCDTWASRIRRFLGLLCALGWGLGRSLVPVKLGSFLTLEAPGTLRLVVAWVVDVET